MPPTRPEYHVDFETRSVVDLTTAELDNYVAHPSTDVWCMGWTVGDVAVQMWKPGDDPLDLPDDAIVYAHNARFEYHVWNRICVPRYGFKPLRRGQMRCTMAMAYAMALPGSLEKAALALGIDRQKDMRGRALMLRMCRPRSLDPLTWWDAPDLVARLADYCRQDVEVERELTKRLLPLSKQEQRVWLLDQEINDRGVFVDRPAVTAALALVEREQDRLNADIRRLTGGRVEKASQVARLLAWVRDQGLDVDGLAKADVAGLLADGELPDDVRAAVDARREAAKSSTAKLVPMIQAAGADGRVRGLFQYHGASTGRWAGRRIQIQNFPRPSLSPKATNGVIDLIQSGARDLVDLLYGPPMKVVSDCLRGMIVAAPGHHLVAADLNAIEARVLAWLAGEEKILDIFRTTGKIYEHAAGGIYGVPIEAIAEDSPERQIGKVAVLALGYQGGVGAFQQMAKVYGVAISDERADEIKARWREANPHIVRYWYALNDAALDAVRAPGRITTAGAAGREVRFRVSGSFLWCQLPSKRVLCYPYPQIGMNRFDRECVTFMGENTLTRKWERLQTYGGRLAENATQALARDVLAEALLRLSQRGYRITAHIHDEVIAEVPADAPESTVKDFEQCMSEAPAWALDLPIKAKGWRAVRWRK